MKEELEFSHMIMTSGFGNHPLVVNKKQPLFLAIPFNILFMP